MPSECWPLQEELKGNRDIPPTLVEICQELHMHFTGSAEGLMPEEVAKMVNILEIAVKHWKPAKARWNKYDEAILNIVKITLEEYNNSWWKEFIDERNMVSGTRLE